MLFAICVEGYSLNGQKLTSRRCAALFYAKP